MYKVSLVQLALFIAFSQVLFSCDQVDKRKSYYEDGKIKSISEMKDGLMHGKHEFYYPSGNLQSRGNYSMGKANGLIEHFYESGKLESKAFWLNGMENGEGLVYFENGIVQFSANYKEGKIIGVSKVFYADGKIRERKLYDSLGSLIHIAVYEPNGDIKNSFVVPSVSALKDTVMLGEEVVLKIKFPFKMKGDIFIQASETDPSGNIFNEPNVHECIPCDSVSYKRVFNSSGKYELSFKFKHTNIDAGDTLNVKNVVKDYTIVVVEPPASARLQRELKETPLARVCNPQLAPASARLQRELKEI